MRLFITLSQAAGTKFHSSYLTPNVGQDGLNTSDFCTAYVPHRLTDVSPATSLNLFLFV